jgi:hypothetical protein
MLDPHIGSSRGLDGLADLAGKFNGSGFPEGPGRPAALAPRGAKEQEKNKEKGKAG